MHDFFTILARGPLKLSRQKSLGLTLIELIIYLALTALLGVFVSRVMVDLYRSTGETQVRNELISLADLFRRQHDICQTVFVALLGNTTTQHLVGQGRLNAALSAQDVREINGELGQAGLLAMRRNGNPLNLGGYEVRLFANTNTTPPHFFVPLIKKTRDTGYTISGLNMNNFGNHIGIFNNLLLGQSLFVDGTCPRW